MALLDTVIATLPKTQKTVPRYCFFYNKSVVTWLSKNKKTVSISIIKAKYIAIGHAIREKI